MDIYRKRFRSISTMELDSWIWKTICFGIFQLFILLLLKNHTDTPVVDTQEVPPSLRQDLMSYLHTIIRSQQCESQCTLSSTLTLLPQYHYPLDGIFRVRVCRPSPRSSRHHLSRPVWIVIILSVQSHIVVPCHLIHAVLGGFLCSARLRASAGGAGSWWFSTYSRVHHWSTLSLTLARSRTIPTIVHTQCTAVR